MRARLLLVVVALLVASCSWRVQVDLSFSPVARASALSAYSRALDQYCLTNQLTPAVCERQRATLTREQLDARALDDLELSLRDVPPDVARHLRGLIAAIRDATRRPR